MVGPARPVFPGATGLDWPAAEGEDPTTIDPADGDRYEGSVPTEPLVADGPATCRGADVEPRGEDPPLPGPPATPTGPPEAPRLIAPAPPSEAITTAANETTTAIRPIIPGGLVKPLPNFRRLVPSNPTDSQALAKEELRPCRGRCQESGQPNLGSPASADQNADYERSLGQLSIIRCAHILRQTARVADGTRASSAYELCDAVPVKRDLIARVVLLFEVATGAVWTQPPMEHRVKVRSTGEIVYRVTTESDLAFTEARASISRDLDRLSIDEFNEQYGLKIRLKGVT